MTAATTLLACDPGVTFAGRALPALRGYQALAVECARRAFAENAEPAYVELPTGCGKTRIAVELAAGEIAAGGRVLVIAHREVLISQLADALGNVSSVGVIDGTRRDFDAPLSVASVRTLARHSGEMKMRWRGDRAVSLVLVDEAHHATIANTYGATLACLRELNARVRIVGFTATPFRLGGGFRRAFPVCAFTRSIANMQDAGWICPLAWRPVQINGLRLKDVQRRGGDYAPAQLAAALSGSATQLVGNVVPVISDRPTIAFAASVDHARELAGAFEKAGIPAAAVWGEQPPNERTTTLAAWRSGTVQIVVNVGVLTEGFDFPELAAVLMARPTRSVGFYLQAIGRVTRLAPGKHDALVIDAVSGDDPRQLRLPALLDAVPLDAADANQSAGGKQAGVRSSILTESGLALSVHEGGARSCSLGCKDDGSGELVVALLPDACGSGLFSAVAFTLTPQGAASCVTALHDRPLPLGDALAHVKPARNVLSDARARWRSRSPSIKSLRYLLILDDATGSTAVAAGWDAGEVSEAIHSLRAGKAIAELQAARDSSERPSRVWDGWPAAMPARASRIVVCSPAALRFLFGEQEQRR